MTVASDLDKLAVLRIPELQEIFLDVMQGIVDSAMLNEMVAAIEANDVERLFRASGFTPAALNPIVDSIEQIYQDSAETTAGSFPKRISTPTGPALFRFNMRNPTVEKDLKEKSSELITRLTEEARQNVRSVLEQGVINGDNPKTTALNIVGRVDPVTKQRVGGVIGLTQNQEQWVRNVQRYLEQGDSRYFSLKLRDKRFDSIVQKSFESGQPIASDTIEKIVTRYKASALKFRGESIARTETIQSINRGEFMANMQLVEDGLVQRSAMTKEWDDVGDRKVRVHIVRLPRNTEKEKVSVLMNLSSHLPARA